MKLKAKLFIRHVSVLFLLALAAAAVSCHWNDISDRDDDDSTSISGLSFGKTSLSLKVGSMDYITIKVNPAGSQKDCEFKWQYDSKIISCDTESNFGVTIAAVSEGQTSLRCSYGGYDATCIVTVSGYEEGYGTTTEPYIYSNTTILQTSPGVTERVSVSLYGGDASDIDGYTWTVDNPSVASIQPTGQYCMITARDSGYTRIKVTHTKAAYPYYIGVYVFEDATEVTYITTQDNILTMNREDASKTISVSLVNGGDISSDNSFHWEVIADDEDGVPVVAEWNGNRAVITPKQGGSCTLRVTHPDASYPLDILCRVITVVKNVYIQPDYTIVYLDGNVEEVVSCKLENIRDGEYSVDDYEYALDDGAVAEIVASVGSQVMLRGVANGSCKLLISHPKAEYPREVLVIVSGQIHDAVDASCYITTSQNYIRTKVGAEMTEITVSLKGGSDGDEGGFTWSVKNVPNDGASDVVRLETTNGTAVHSRAASLTYAYGTAYITPEAEGTAVITVNHPKILYPTEILVKVLGKDAILEEQLYFTGSGLLRIVNGESAEYRVELKGTKKSPSDDGGIQWSIEDARLSVAGNENVATVTAPAYGTGSTMSWMTVRHSKADADKRVLVMTADDQETLMNMKALYSDKLYYNLEVGNEVAVMASAVGFEPDVEGEAYDFSGLVWKIKDPSVISVEKDSFNPLLCSVRGLKSGVTTLSAVFDGVNCDFTITVYPIGTVAVEPEVYLTTYQNVVPISSVGKTANVSVSAINLKAAGYSGITWTSGNAAVAEVIPNGTSAVVTAVSEGEAVISVSHPDSQNTLKIYVRVGSEYVIPPAEPVVYISAQDVMTMLRDDAPQKLHAVLVNAEDSADGEFSFVIDNNDVAEIAAQSVNGTAYIKPVGSGQAEVTISHPAAGVTKKVLVIVGNSAEELAGFTYLTTGSNVVAVGEGSTKSVSVQVQNAAEIVLEGYTWASSSPDIVDVMPNGATALLKGNSIGTAVITVTNRYCQYPLQIIAQCVNPIAAAESPYIQLTSSVMTLTVGTTYTSVTADLVGGKESDRSDFSWDTDNSGIASVYGQNEVGKIRAVGAGTTYITVSHPKAVYPAQILVVCDNAVTSDCYISVPSSIVSMKPTDSSQTITATLINGTTIDKYNFNWSLDVYDIIDFQYSANVCTITPKQTGSVTVTISHPKAAYDQKIIVNVQQYTEFGFPSDSRTIEQGDVQFITMQVPVTTLATHIEYSVDNSSICSLTGTKTVAQLTAVSPGTTIVRARLVASGTGIEQASAEMMVYVKERATDAVYITAPTTIFTVIKGKSQTLSANLSGTGVVASDQYNLKWTTNDSDVIQITGISSDGTVSGQSIYITAIKSGEALISCTHEKAASALQFYVVVPGSAEKVVTLNKSYMTLTKGSSGSTLKATIENAEGSSDYNNLIWTCEGANGSEVVRIMGSGQTVTIYPLAVGEATVMAQLPDSASVAKCTVLVEAGKSFSFEVNARRVEPFHSKLVNYTVSPPDAVLAWSMAQTDDFFTYNDLGCDSNGKGQVEIVGIKEGTGTLACVTDGMAKGQISVTVSWDYEFSLSGSTTFSITPLETREIGFKVNPADADIHVVSTDANLFDYEILNGGQGSGSVVIKPKSESAGNVSIVISATNPNKGGEEIGSKTVTAKFQYKSLTPKITLVSSDGAWSKWNNDAMVLTIGDGETVQFKVDIVEDKAVGSIRSVSFNPEDDSFKTVSATSTGDATWKLKLCDDKTEMQYRIVKAYLPYYLPNGSSSTYQVPIVNWQTDIKWRETSDEVYNGYNDYWGLVSDTYTTTKTPNTSSSSSSYYSCDGMKWVYLKRDKDSSGTWGSYFTIKEELSLAGRIYSVYEFRSIPWFYNPGTTNDGHETKYVTYPVSNPGNFGKGSTVHEDEGVVTHNVNAVYETSTDTSVTASRRGGKLCIVIAHVGKDQPNEEIPVYYEERKCSKSYK